MRPSWVENSSVATSPSSPRRLTACFSAAAVFLYCFCCMKSENHLLLTSLERWPILSQGRRDRWWWRLLKSMNDRDTKAWGVTTTCTTLTSPQTHYSLTHLLIRCWCVTQASIRPVVIILDLDGRDGWHLNKKINSQKLYWCHSVITNISGFGFVWGFVLFFVSEGRREGDIYYLIIWDLN